MDPYDRLASVYPWIVPEAILDPATVVDAYGAVPPGLPARARVLDCAAGTGELAVGMALRGHDVTASDASPAMLRQAEHLAEKHGVALPTVTSTWEELARHVTGPFDLVLCAGNSLAHAEGTGARRSALAAMRHVLSDGGSLLVTSRNWELIRARRPGLEVEEELVRRHGRPAVVVRSWTVPEAWEAEHAMAVAVALVGDGDHLQVIQQRLTFRPFRHDELAGDLRAAGLEPAEDTWTPDADRYAVWATARS